jgi:hypothetical protein
MVKLVKNGTRRKGKIRAKKGKNVESEVVTNRKKQAMRPVA